MTAREQKLLKENEELRIRLREAEDACNALTKGGVEPNEETVRVSERKIRGILDATRESIWMFSPDGIILLVNPTACERFGKSEIELVGRRVEDVLPRELARSRMERLRKVVQTATPLEFEDERAGSYFRHSFYPVTDEKGNVTSVVSFSRDITDRKKSEDALQDNEKLLKSVLDNVSSGVAMIDDTGKFSVFNPLFLKLFGLTENYTIKNVNDQNWADWQVFNEDGTLLHVDDHPVRKAAMTGKLVEHQLVGVKVPSGDDITWMLISAEPILKDDGSIDKIICTYHDVTALRKVGEELRQSREQLAAVFNGVSETLMLLDIDGTILISNKIFDKRFNPGNSDTVGKSIFDFVPFSFHEIRKQQIKDLVRTKKPITFLDNFNDLYLEITFYPVFDNHGDVKQFISSALDITERKKAEEAIRRQTETLEGINRVLEATLTTETEEELGTKCLEIIQEITRSKFGFIGEINESGLEDIAISNPASIGLPPGHPPLEAFLGVPLKYEGRTIGIIAVANRPGGYTLTDQESIEAIAPAIVEAFMRKRTEAAARASESEKTKLATILGLSSQPFAVGYPDGTIGYLNKEFETLTGYTAEELRSISWEKDLTPPEYIEMEQIYLNHLLETGMPVRYEKEYIRKNGTRVPVELLVSTMPDAGGKPEYFYSFLTDITERKKNERNLRQLIRTLSAMQKSSLMMAQATDENQFLSDVCRIIIEDCGHQMVWIGYKEDDPGKTVKPMAYAGFEDDYLETLKITWGESERGRGPTGTAIRTGKPALCRDMHTDPVFKPWRKEALKRGYSSSIVLPLKMDEKVFGAVTIYSREPNPFSQDEQLLLTKLADDLAYGIKAIRLNLALKQSKANLEVKVKERTALLGKAMEDLGAERQRFLDVLNMLPVYVALISPDCRIRYANKVFKENFGEPEEKKCHVLLFGKSEMCDDCRLSAVPNTEKPSQWEAVGLNGRVFQVSDFSFTDIDGVPVILEMGSDITEKKDIEKFVMSKIMETEERDRKRFAGDLHDDLGPTLSAVKLQLNLLNAMNSEKERKELLNAIDQLLSESVDKMRNIANTIMPRLISNFGLEAALNSFVNKLGKSSNIRFSIHSNLCGYRFDEETELHLYRIMTELVNNTIKHAGASVVSIDMERTEKEFRVVYSDNGKGYNVDKISTLAAGIGLQNIRNRINLIGGTVSFKSVNQKTVVSISVPINNKV